MANASLGAGNVDIELNGESATLRPTLQAAQTISRSAGGIMGAIRSLRSLDIDVLTGIIAAGLGKREEDVAEAIFRTGAASLIPAATEFVTILANGGRPAGKHEGGEGEADPQTA